VLRHIEPGGTKINWLHGKSLFNYPAVKKVKSWKVLLGASSQEGWGHPSGGFLHLCQAIVDIPNRSLQVGVIPRGKRFEGPINLHLRSMLIYNTMDVILNPLQILRNLKSLTITQAWFDDLEVRDPASDISQVTPHEIPEDLIAQLRSDTRGSQPIVHVFKMYQRLVIYAQAFERNGIFRAEMDPEWGTAWIRQMFEKRGRMNQNMRSHSLGAIFSKLSFFKWEGTLHPVERNLELASISSATNDYDGFKIARRTVLHSLEAQYQRITKSARMMADYVKDIKDPDFLLTPAGSRLPGTPMTFAFALTELEDYARAFPRDLTKDTRCHIRRHQRRFDLAYANLPREKLLKELSDILECSDPASPFSDDLTRFLELYRLAESR